MSEEKEEEREEEYRNLPGWYSPSEKVRIVKNGKKSTMSGLNWCVLILTIIGVILVLLWNWFVAIMDATV